MCRHAPSDFVGIISPMVSAARLERRSDEDKALRLKAQLLREKAKLLRENALLRGEEPPSSLELLALVQPQEPCPEDPALGEREVLRPEENRWLAVEIHADIPGVGQMQWNQPSGGRRVSRRQLSATTRPRGSSSAAGLASIAECNESECGSSTADESTVAGSYGEGCTTVGSSCETNLSCVHLDVRGGAFFNEAPEHTTVLVRNVPTCYSRSAFLSLLDRRGFARTYDFVYLPMDLSTGVGFGYAIVNFAQAASAKRFREAFTNVALPSSKEPCAVVWHPQRQGLDALVARFRNSPVMQEGVADEFQPLILVDGQRVHFPAPTPSKPR